MDNSNNDIQYFHAVIDTANLISTWRKKYSQEDIKKLLINLEMNLESKYGPFTSKLSSQIGMDETLGLKSPDSYWKGVQDTLSLLKNFITWKQQTGSPRTVVNFLMEIVNKSNLRIEPEESPLITALGILFDHEFTDSSASLNQESKFSFLDEPAVEPSPSKIAETVTAKSNPIPEPKQSAIDNDKAFNPKEFIDDEKFLDQFIADSISPPEEKRTQDSVDFGESERDYLRSALEELSITSSEEKDQENEKEIPFQFKGEIETKTKINDQISERASIIEDDFDEKDKSRLLSSSLRDALRMLREED